MLWAFEVNAGLYAGEIVYGKTFLTPSSLWKLKGWLGQMGRPSEDSVRLVSEDFAGITVMGKLVHDGKYPQVDDIKSLDSYEPPESRPLGEDECPF